ncbi:hypothetical protein QBC35DRAFT_465047 [Podospora australis]|uniref:BTB domain-containing protein n=1 Tax=Podospora australis TaxID=1536484 RepID=A0AAN6WQV0_9PEZI|nr:hypothetical protein QBC35DRAFT_465047 [Podospora australis]
MMPPTRSQKKNATAASSYERPTEGRAGKTTPGKKDDGPSNGRRRAREQSTPRSVRAASPGPIAVSEPAGREVQSFPPIDSNWVTGRMVSLVIGDGTRKKRYAVHEALLSKESPYFFEIFNGPDKANEFALPFTDPKLFDLFTQWLYGNAFSFGPAGRRGGFRFAPPGPHKDQTIVIRDYLELYVLGYDFGMESLRNSTMDVIYDHYGPVRPDHEAPAMEDVEYIFRNTPPDSPMRRFLIAHLCFFLFSEARQGQGLPEGWFKFSAENHEINTSIIRMLGDWNWVIGKNAPGMVVKKRTEFYEYPPIPIKIEGNNGNPGVDTSIPPASGNGNVNHEQPQPQAPQNQQIPQSPQDGDQMELDQAPIQQNDQVQPGPAGRPPSILGGGDPLQEQLLNEHQQHQTLPVVSARVPADAKAPPQARHQGQLEHENSAVQTQYHRRTREQQRREQQIREQQRHSSVGGNRDSPIDLNE